MAIVHIDSFDLGCTKVVFVSLLYHNNVLVVYTVYCSYLILMPQIDWVYILQWKCEILCGPASLLSVLCDDELDLNHKWLFLLYINFGIVIVINIH